MDIHDLMKQFGERQPAGAGQPHPPGLRGASDAGEQGPLVVAVDEDVYIVQPDGKTRKQAK